MTIRAREIPVVAVEECWLKISREMLLPWDIPQGWMKSIWRLFYSLGNLHTPYTVQTQHKILFAIKVMWFCEFCDLCPDNVRRFCFYVLFTRRYSQHSNICLLVWIHSPLIKLHLTENSMIQSFDRSGIMLSRQPLNIFTVFNGPHMAKNNISLAWSTLHFHPKQIHSVNWVSETSQTKTRVHRNWKNNIYTVYIYEGVCVGSSHWATHVCLCSNKCSCVGSIWSFYWAPITLQHAGGNTMQVHNGWFTGLASIKRGTDKCRRQTLFYLNLAERKHLLKALSEH